MSTSFKSQTDGSENKDELIVHEGEADQGDDRSSVGAQMRDMAARIPEQLSAIGRDISRTIERAISAKDDYMLAAKVSHDAQIKLGQLVQAGVFGTRNPRGDHRRRHADAQPQDRLGGVARIAEELDLPGNHWQIDGV